MAHDIIIRGQATRAKRTRRSHILHLIRIPRIIQLPGQIDMVSQAECQARRDRIEAISLEIMIALVFEHEHHSFRLIGIELSGS